MLTFILKQISNIYQLFLFKLNRPMWCSTYWILKKNLIRPSLSYRQLSTILTHKTNLAQFTDTYRWLKLGSCFVHAYTKDYSFLLLTAALLHKQKILNTAYCLNCTNYCKTSRGVCQCVDMSSHWTTSYIEPTTNLVS